MAPPLRIAGSSLSRLWARSVLHGWVRVRWTPSIEGGLDGASGDGSDRSLPWFMPMARFYRLPVGDGHPSSSQA
ncbi:hypothetical protein IAQ61_002205 [Plenodomus lingam]|uniref:uncharacterized protein n=1 Tax=Leptosphaeria maculans TaxID=5022 RepID=UPI00332CBE72|nr:hypothetical protein IAQ61_002205 [Plenodomus lingam]